MKTIRPVSYALFTGTAAIALMAQPAAAQSAAEQTAQAANQPEDESDEDVIVVTATKRASTVQDVPFSIDAQTQKDIQRANASTVEDLSRNVAGLTIQNLGPGQSQVSVRGVSAGQVVRDQPGVKEQVGIYLDESVISLSLFTPDIDLYDLNRVETLRGPQGTLFGSGSVGGTLRYITNQPEIGVNEGSFELNANTVHEGGSGGHIKGMVNIDLGDTLALRAVGYIQKFPGFIDANGAAAGQDVNDGMRSGGRIALTYEPTDTVRITPRVVFQNISTDGFNRQEVYNLYGNAFTDPPVNLPEREQILLLREGFEDDFMLADLTASFEFGPVELTSVTSYTNRDILVSRDASALTGSVSVDLGYPRAAVLLPSNLRDTTDLTQWTQELRLASTGTGPLSWVVGGFYSDTDRLYQQRLPTPGYDAVTDAVLGAGTSAAVANDVAPTDSPYAADLPYDIKQTAVFGEVSYDFGNLTATVGGRYYDFEEEREFNSGGLFANGDNAFDRTTSDGFTPRFILSYDATADLTLNLQASQGFRLGGVNDPLNVTLCSPEDEALFGSFQSYDDEKLWNYEAGVKYQAGGITFNAAAFHTEISNLQVTLDAGSCSSRVVFNVDDAHTTGIEAEFSANLMDGFDISVAGSYINAEFDSTLPEPLATATGIREGNRLPTVPKFQMAATATYVTPVNSRADAVLTATFQHVGSRYTQPADQENNPRTFAHGLPFNGQDGTETTTVDLLLPSYQLFDLSAGIEFDHGLDLVVYVKNVFDENALLSFDRERGGRARLAYTVGTPRTIGITLRKDF
ncbi:TonB-dependent receptor [Sphingomicrobium flavum]|uniref:TonB-dependent receptor n=1 Tax=Sphingomicrobium flavum TaxID=1229164 RepID=UPI0021AD9C28|nr:TonB-dependent receptor [Sphingomicrobium flavum]